MFQKQTAKKKEKMYFLCNYIRLIIHQNKITFLLKYKSYQDLQYFSSISTYIKTRSLTLKFHAKIFLTLTYSLFAYCFILLNQLIKKKQGQKKNQDRK